MNLGPTIQRLRHRIPGLTQKAMGAAMGVTAGFIAQLEGNHRQPSFPTLLKLSAALQVPVAFLFVLADDSDHELMPRLKSLVEKAIR